MKNTKKKAFEEAKRRGKGLPVLLLFAIQYQSTNFSQTCVQGASI